MMGGGGGGGGWGGGMNRGGGGPGPGMLANVADVDGAVYDPHITRRALTYVRPYRGGVAFSLLMTFAQAALLTIGPIWTKVAIDNYVSTGDYIGMTVFLGLTLLAYFGSFLANWAQFQVMTVVGQRMLQSMRSDMVRHIQRLPLQYFDKTPAGVVVSRVINDVQTVNELLSNGIVQALSDVLTLTFTVMAMVILAPKLALVTFAVMPLMVIAVWIFTEKAKVAYRRSRITIATLTGEFAESFAGVRVVQAFAREDASFEQFDALNEDNRVANIKANTLSSMLLPIVELCNAAATVAVIAYGGWLMVNGGEVTLGVLVAFLAYITRFFQPIRTLTQFYNQLQAATAAAEKVFELLDEPITIHEAQEPVVIPHVRGEVEFRDVTFSYGREPVLDDVSFHADPGEMIALVGHTGAGKTTIASLLCRFYDPVAGAVLLDGYDLREVSFKTLRSSIGLVLQDNFLFSGSIGDNIRYGRPEASQDQIIAAAKVANAHEFIMRMADGYETPVLERAANLSLGQRQLIAIARAVLADPRVLILDEATSNIDSQTELLVQQALGKLLAGRTSLVIAHRLSTIRAADQVLVLDGGRVIERGTHRTLLAERGHYFSLYQQQFAEMVPA
ncbi:MAG: ABC transporter ATP-binding protein [Chloroflexi bacterium]|nr:ABC transporter ATP-binding protein [Chloroflexota bacterium]MBV9600490.1 ABC transporter ATP-binding protein [Chloroflexota bacterium]